MDKLKPPPDRYILVTSKPLSSDNLEELCQALHPHCQGPDDIIDGTELDVRLGDDPELVKRHLKLWLSSAGVLESILNAAVLNRSAAYTQALVRDSRVFVEPNTLQTARDLLNDEHTCIISGPPGVGKTTLANILTLEYLAQGFDLFVVSEDIREAEQVLKIGAKQLFLYDDFLGRSNLSERLGKNEDSRLIRFIQRVQELPDHRFILTTREYILRAARSTYEALDASGVDRIKLVLEMEDYTPFEKGMILYNHLYFSDDLDPDDIMDLVVTRSYRDIIKHPNYTPRHINDALVQWSTRRAR